eukprot:TRINITY_DN39323_c0_g1_i1.p1 TRINITY_DN39323_c0_g1~~TRINITY_DN39323_c0_g1_i1.p1  ORF type:complete len:151 (-),score=26.85 TRINITY_DN39323_c0_g1_i1:214-666(-)
MQCCLPDKAAANLIEEVEQDTAIDADVKLAQIPSPSSAREEVPKPPETAVVTTPEVASVAATNELSMEIPLKAGVRLGLIFNTADRRLEKIDPAGLVSSLLADSKLNRGDQLVSVNDVTEADQLIPVLQHILREQAVGSLTLKFAQMASA